MNEQHAPETGLTGRKVHGILVEGKPPGLRGARI